MEDERNYDLGIILTIDHGYAMGRILDTDEPFKIKLRAEVVDSLEEYMVIAINLDHTDFMYQ